MEYIINLLPDPSLWWVMIPFIALGLVLGVYLVKVVPESLYRKLVIWITLFSALILLF
ncbi:MAG: hypothetical protein SNG49_08485 [Rikenellaceae bacterium]